MGDAYESVTVDIEGHVAQVTLVGPGKGNAMGPAFWAEMPEVFAKLDADRDVRAIVLTGSGKNFSYGLDLPAMGGSLSGVLADGATDRPRAYFHAPILRMQGAINAVADCRTPTIASVHGWCIGGGVGLISAVDIRYASADAKFSVREVKLAIVADVGSLARLPLILSDGHLRGFGVTGKGRGRARPSTRPAPRRSACSTTSTTTRRRRWPLRTRRPPRSQATHRWWSTASRTCWINSVLPASRRACAMWRRGTPRARRPRASPRGCAPSSRSGHRSSAGNRSPAELRLGLGVRQRKPRAAEGRRRVGGDQAHQLVRYRHWPRTMEPRGQLADIAAERLRSVVDDVVHLPAAALVDRVGRRRRNVVDVDPWHHPIAGHRRQCPPLGQSDEQFVVRHAGPVEDAVAQYDSLGVTVLPRRQDRLLHAAQRRQHVVSALRRRPRVWVCLVHHRRPRRRIAVGEDHRLCHDPTHAGVLCGRHQVRSAGLP